MSKDNINKQVISVPSDIQYISQWTDYNFPRGHCIVDKGVTGCGYTEFALRNDKNVILCSPRKLLLENKAEQHVEDDNILYLKNEISDQLTKEEFDIKISDHIVKCNLNHKPIKFMITYDSTHYLIDHLQKLNLIGEFYLIADEFQVLFLDSFFKVEVENSFLETIQRCPNIIYLSATPLQDEYLLVLDEFKDLPFYYLDWSDSPYVSKLIVNRKHTTSLGAEARRVIEQYLNGEFPYIVTDNQTIVRSTEAVFYFNSVNEIIRLIKAFKFKPEEVNILCANADYNVAKLKRVKHKIGRIPLKGEKNKMFTFCTSTCYIGSDFYSDCASTYIFADPNLENLALDISLDLPQIAGRQRNINNPFKNIINLFYKTTREDKIVDEASFRELQNEKRKRTLDLMDMFYSSKKNEQESFRICWVDHNINYCKCFLSISREGVSYNKLIEIANERAFRIQQRDYQDDINVTRVIRETTGLEKPDIQQYKDKFDEIVNDFLRNRFTTTGIFETKLKYFCEFMDEYKDNRYIIDQLRYKILDLRYINYYMMFGTQGCKALGWKDADIRRSIFDHLSSDKLSSKVQGSFVIGKRYSNKELKTAIGNIYDSLGISECPKATDIKKWFNVKEVNFPDPVTKGRLRGYEIISTL